MSMTYYCAAPECEVEGKHVTGGRLFCDGHNALLMLCHCADDRTFLLPGESCDKCGYTNRLAGASQ